ncbi:hypothetical protein CCH79_00016868 [Gambusia affinis]|uniref:Uncharacterized protein n=1 Tax=Gambusia affinis TaxID=33528 RepID=A0A315WAV4_GAMAF|nr:hypothetical protein CCH79_00016868 [Gambusia affinis]
MRQMSPGPGIEPATRRPQNMGRAIPYATTARPSVKLSREAWRAGFRQAVTNMKFNLGWDHVLVSQQLQLPYSTSLRQLEEKVWITQLQQPSDDLWYETQNRVWVKQSSTPRQQEIKSSNFNTQNTCLKSVQ